jgi:hypothetical protein
VKTVRISGILLEGHKGAAVEIPFDPAERWGRAAMSLRPGRRGHRVHAKVAGVCFNGAVVARSRRFFLPIDRAICAAAGLAIGDPVVLTLEPVD